MTSELVEKTDDALLAIARGVEVRGGEIIAELDTNITELSRVYHGEVYDIGQFGSILKVKYGRRLIFAMVKRLRMKTEYELERMGRTEAKPDERVLEADLIGQAEYILDSSHPSKKYLNFERGVTTFPLPLQTVYLTPKSELRQIYATNQRAPLDIGTYVGVEDTRCVLDTNEFLGKHAAILGSTGAGKSACVAAIVGQLARTLSGNSASGQVPKVIMFDPHNEYGRAFPDGRVLSTDNGSLRLPLWLLNYQETVDFVVGRSERAATNQASVVRDALASCRSTAAGEIGLSEDDVTIDSPLPYRLDDLVDKIKEARPESNKTQQAPYDAVLEKLRIRRLDSRLSFMLSSDAPTSDIPDESNETLGDPLVAVMQQFLGQEQAPAIVDLSGVPSEVAGIVTGTIGRILFSWRLWQDASEREKDPIVIVCEEAHLYVPSSGTAQYAEAQSAIRRIVREGRKYGVGLIVVSQRPSEIDETVLSQCSTWVVLRVTNENDQARIRAALPEAMTGLASALPSLRRQEAVVTGQSIAFPARIRIRDLSEGELPSSQDVDFIAGWAHGGRTADDMLKIARRWQTQDAQ
ncbi:MAG: ATP-binding protein [Acidimicrobiaceae bacterium]|nr:ATP-binding protein [Acidimicrobiaceae bacterium]